MPTHSWLAGVLPEGSNLTYNLMVTNNGPTNDTSVVLIDAFGANWKYISATEGQFTRSDSVIMFSLSSVAAGQTVTASVKAQPPKRKRNRQCVLQ